MKEVTVTLNGCDDCTFIVVSVDSSGKALLEQIAKASEKASTYQCMPTMSVDEGNTIPNYLLEGE